MKRIVILALALALLVSISACGESSGSNDVTETVGNAIEDDSNDKDKNISSLDESPESEPTSPGNRSEAQGALKEALGDSSVLFYESVNNDVTGRWRLLVYNSAENIVEHSVEYYNAYFESDDEIHVVVNLELRTTGVITYSSGYLFIDVHEYIDEEEDDAKILGSGALLNSYTVNISSGEIKNLSVVEGETGESINLKSIEEAITAALPQEYQSNKWYLISCDSYPDGGISVDLQIDQGTDNADNALSLAVECFGISRSETEQAGAELESFSITVVNNGAPIGLFSTNDGKTFVSISDGKRTEISI